MTTQAHKYELVGEFLVAGELGRRGIHCNVTYGNAKQVEAN
jgi:hypothetical protein